MIPGLWLISTKPLPEDDGGTVTSISRTPLEIVEWATPFASVTENELPSAMAVVPNLAGKIELVPAIVQVLLEFVAVTESIEASPVKIKSTPLTVDKLLQSSASVAERTQLTEVPLTETTDLESEISMREPFTANSREPSNEDEAPTAGKVRSALFRAASRIVPLFRASELVAE